MILEKQNNVLPIVFYVPWFYHVLETVKNLNIFLEFVAYWRTFDIRGIFYPRIRIFTLEIRRKGQVYSQKTERIYRE